MSEAHSDPTAPLAIVCAGGVIPFAVADAVKKEGRPFVLFAIEGVADATRVQNYPHHWMGLGKFGRFVRLARQEGCRDVVFIGSLTRPSLWQIRFDFDALVRLPRIIAAYRGGDDHLLTGIARLLEADGFRVIGAHEVAPQVLMPVGVLTARKPSPRDQADIARALEVLSAIGPLDIAQAAVVAEGQVLAVESVEGTDAMLAQLADARSRGRVGPAAGIGALVKAPKPKQDRRYDLPAIGPRTVASAVRAGLAGIAVIAGGSVVAELESMIEAADRDNIFILGIKGRPLIADSPPLKVFLVAGEESGDRLGAALMRGLKSRTQGAVEFSGVGGGHMTREGLQSLFPLRETAFMGISSIPARAFNVLRRIRQAADAAVNTDPDILVIIDSPEFTHRIARRVRRAAPAIPIVDYVSPSVWAWRPGRARAMRGYIDRVLALLPFEPAVHQRLGGPPCSYIGHPLSERIPVLRPNADEQRRRDADPPILLIMPGSRRGEIEHMLGIFAQAAELVIARLGPVEIMVATVPELAQMVSEAVARWPVPARVIADVAHKDAVFRTARAAIVKSGTGTLELALAGIPMVAGYKAGAIEVMIVRRLMTLPSVILANLVLGENVVPEFLQGNLMPKRLADAVIPLIGNTPQRQAQLDAFRRLDTIMEVGRLVPSDRAAQIVLETARGHERVKAGYLRREIGT